MKGEYPYEAYIGAVLLALMFLPDLFREEEPKKRGKYEKPPQRTMM